MPGSSGYLYSLAYNTGYVWAHTVFQFNTHFPLITTSAVWSVSEKLWFQSHYLNLWHAVQWWTKFSTVFSQKSQKKKKKIIKKKRKHWFFLFYLFICLFFISSSIKDTAVRNNYICIKTKSHSPIFLKDNSKQHIIASVSIKTTPPSSDSFYASGIFSGRIWEM